MSNLNPDVGFAQFVRTAENAWFVPPRRGAMALLAALLLVGAPTTAHTEGGGYSGPARPSRRNPGPRNPGSPSPRRFEIDSVGRPVRDPTGGRGEGRRRRHGDLGQPLGPDPVAGDRNRQGGRRPRGLRPDRPAAPADRRTATAASTTSTCATASRWAAQYVDIVVSGGSDMAIYKIDPFTRQLVDITARTITAANQAEGVCLYRSPYTGRLLRLRPGLQRQRGAAGAVRQRRRPSMPGRCEGRGTSTQRRSRSRTARSKPARSTTSPATTTSSSRTSACGATGRSRPPPRSSGHWCSPPYLVNDGHLVPDIEGVAVIYDDFGSYLLASSQGESAFGVYRLDLLTTPLRLLRQVPRQHRPPRQRVGHHRRARRHLVLARAGVPPRPVRLPGQHQQQAQPPGEPELQVRPPRPRSSRGSTPTWPRTSGLRCQAGAVVELGAVAGSRLRRPTR